MRRGIPFVRAPVSARLPLLRWWDGDRGQIDSLRTVGVARATVVAFVQREGGGSDDGSEGNRNRERVDARGFQYQSGARPNHHAVDYPDHAGGRKCQLPCAGRARLRRTRLSADDEVRLELRREPQVEAAKERDPPCVGEVLDRGLNQTQERHDPHERQHRQEDQRERVERRAEPGHLADEGKRDQVAGQGSEVDAGASVGFGHGERAGGLQVEVLGGRERGRGAEAWTESVRQWRSARVASVVRSLSRAPRVSAAADGEPGRCVGSAHCTYLNGWRNASPALAPGTGNTSRLSSRMSATTIWLPPVFRSHSSETVSSASWRVSSSTNMTVSFLAPLIGPAGPRVEGSCAAGRPAASAFAGLVISRTPRPRVAKLMDQRMSTSSRSGRDATHVTANTTLPRRPRSRLRANASRADASGKISTDGRRSWPASASLAIDQSWSRFGSTVKYSPPSGGSSATETSRPPGRSTAPDRRSRSPPTVSNTRSTGATASSKPVAASTASCAPSSRTSPSSAAAAVPITYASRVRASWTASPPTAPVAPWIITRSPAASRPWSNRPCQAVRAGMGIAALSARLSDRGLAASSSAGTLV